MSKRKKNKKKEVEPLRLYIDYDETRRGGRALSNEPYSDREDEHVEVHFNGIFRSMGDDGRRFFYDSKEVTKKVYEADEVALVVVRYDTGDTFGRTYNSWCTEGIYLLDEAKKVADSIQNKTYEGYKAWEGYFENYRCVEIHVFDTEDEYKKNSARIFRH